MPYALWYLCYEARCVLVSTLIYTPLAQVLGDSSYYLNALDCIVVL